MSTPAPSPVPSPGAGQAGPPPPATDGPAQLGTPAPHPTAPTPPQPRPPGRLSGRGWRILGRLITLALLLLALGFGTLLYGWHLYTARGPLERETNLVIARGTGLDTIAAQLDQAGIVAHRHSFTLAATLAGGPIRAGEYAFPAGASLQEVVAILRSGRTVIRRLTVREGLTLAQVVALVTETEGLAGTIEPGTPEGSLLPETWHYSWGDARAAVLRRMREAMERFLAEAWAQRAPNLPLATAQEALVLASIVEKETGRAEERARVAGVFVNRLRRGMPLQSDPTVIYAVTRGAGPLDRPLSRADLETESPFNTYRVRGLPPAPIANPGRDAIRAVMRPEAHDLLYFVSDGAGGHVFSRTLEEHNRAVARLRAIERERAGANRTAPASAPAPAVGGGAPAGNRRN